MYEGKWLKDVSSTSPFSSQKLLPLSKDIKGQREVRDIKNLSMSQHDVNETE